MSGESFDELELSLTQRNSYKLKFELRRIIRSELSI